MKRDPAWKEPAAAPVVVHVVGRITDEVARFLGPATDAVASSGHGQTLVLIDDARLRHRLLVLHASVELVLVERQRNPLAQWRAVGLACRRALAGTAVQAVHLHGVLPALVGAHAVREARLQAPIFFSPHGAWAWRAAAARLIAAWRPLRGPARDAVILPRPGPDQSFGNWAAVALVESPVGDSFFNVPRHEARHPLVVSGGRGSDARSAELVAQLAVLLSGEALRISFNWNGSVDPVSRQRLNAAGVSVFDAKTDAERAARLGAGWIYVAAGRSQRFALPLVQAMAAGLPCVALDCAQHREVIRNGDTGFLCASEREVMDRIAALVDDEALRRRIGTAARQEARQRFGGAAFGTRLLAAYDLPAAETA